ncbi:MAG: T9SS type A sorting domain-containing protein [Bacteroidales bacterium]|nr:T9SS type A sorting domain-containing protein [Bacteroidales bacterium]
MRSKIIYPALTVLFLFGLYGSACGQTPVLKWTKQYPAQQEANAAYTAEKILETSDGFVICGSRHVQVGTNPAKDNVFVLKIDKAGAIIWFNNYDIENPEDYESDEYVYSIVQNDMGNFFVTGLQTLKPEVIVVGGYTKHLPRGRVMILEIMADGTQGRNFDTEDEVDIAEGWNICKTINGTFVITGVANKFSGTGIGMDQILIGEFTGHESEAISFTSFPYYYNSLERSISGKWATSIIPSIEEAPYHVAGRYFDQEKLDDIFLMNVNETGSYEWSLMFGGDDKDFLMDVVIIGDYYYLVGYSKVPVGEYQILNYQVYVVKVDPSAGSDGEKWQKTYGGTGIHYANAAFKADDGNLVVMGYTYKQNNAPLMFLMKIDAGSGDLIWREDYDFNSAYRDVIQTTDFDYLLAGKGIISGVPDKRILLVYMSSREGYATVVIPHWAIGLGLVSTSDNIDVVTATDLTDNLYGVSVTINELLHPDVSNLEIFLEHGGISVKLVARNTASGINFINTNFSDASENPIASGSAPYTGSFIPAESLRAFNGTDPKGDWTLRTIDYSTKGEKSSTGTLNAWTLKLLSDAGSGTGIHSAAGTEDLMLNPCYPNPAQEKTRIDFNILSNDKVNISVYNQAGQVVAKLIDEVLTPGYYSMVWNVHDISPGIYFIRLETNGISCSQKLVVLK